MSKQLGSRLSALCQSSCRFQQCLCRHHRLRPLWIRMWNITSVATAMLATMHNLQYDSSCCYCCSICYCSPSPALLPKQLCGSEIWLCTQVCFQTIDPIWEEPIELDFSSDLKNLLLERIAVRVRFDVIATECTVAHLLHRSKIISKSSLSVSFL